MRTLPGLATSLLLAALACSNTERAEENTEAAPPPAAAPAPTPPADAGAGGTATLPAGVTQEMVTAGGGMFPTSVCGACHSPQGTGVQGLGPNLTDATWLNVDGSYESIVQVITNGVPTPKESPSPMPPKGGNAGLTDEQVRQLAAWVYAQSHRG